MKKICVIGMGYIGLPTAVMFANKGYDVVGVDVNEKTIDTLIRGELHIFEPGLKELVEDVVFSGKLQPSLKPEPADAFIIAVPTPLIDNKDKSNDTSFKDLPKADLSYVIAAAESISEHLTGGNLVVLESTVPPGTTDDILLPIFNQAGLHVRRDYSESPDELREVIPSPLDQSVGENELFVAHCPERVLPGHIMEELIKNDRIVGGVNHRSAILAKSLYDAFVEGTILLTDATTAEMVKLMENTFRDVNIALANEFARVSEQVGINVWEAIELANLHPRVTIHNPGPGVGGHCIAVDPWFIVEVATDITPLITTARKVNDEMPIYVVEQINEMLTNIDNPIVACLGISYKANVDDIRESPALRVINRLIHMGYTVKAYDPYVTNSSLSYLQPSLEETVKNADLLVILTDHQKFSDIDPDMLADTLRGKRIYDTRNSINKNIWQSSGYQITTLGEGIQFLEDLNLLETK